MQLFYPNGTLAADGFQTVVSSDLPGWQHTGVRVAELFPGDSVSVTDLGIERIFLPLNGSFIVDYEVDGSGEIQKLAGRKSPFHGTTDSLYLPVGSKANVSGEGRIAICEAPAFNKKPVKYSPADSIPVEIRGSGRATRQVNNFGTPAHLDADRFIVCEVITPGDNWSSYPPHKHDEYRPGVESNLEEIYYFEVAVARGLGANEVNDPIGYFRNYGTVERPIDTMEEVRNGDVALVPHGYHGPAMAAPGYDLYYLNVMAGPDPERIWNMVDDPNHHWVRKTWENQETDPRLPYTAQEN